jgi:transcriptional regulator with XRE-family HTH domain
MGGTADAVSASGRTEGDGRRRFGRLLAVALKGLSMKQEDLARALGTTQSSVSGWINGKYEPAATTVFTIERSLGLEPGHLSRPLGYLPVEAASASIGVEAAIAQSSLGEDEKAAMVAMYRVLVKHNTPVARPAAVAVATSTRGRGPGRSAAPPSAERHRSVAGSR